MQRKPVVVSTSNCCICCWGRACDPAAVYSTVGITRALQTHTLAVPDALVHNIPIHHHAATMAPCSHWATARPAALSSAAVVLGPCCVMLVSQQLHAQM